MSPAAALQIVAPVQSVERPAPNRETELFFGKTKGDKTMGKDKNEKPLDEQFLQNAGLRVADKTARIDDYRLVDGPDFANIGIRTFEMKSGDLAENIADGFFDTAIIGMDVLREFNAASRGQKGRMNLVPVANLDMAPCALAIAVGENSGVQTIEDLNGKTIVTKYPASVEAWARKNKIQFAKIMKRNGGIESYGVLQPGVVIADMVETGGSLAVNGWRVLGMDENTANAIKTGMRKFSDLSMEEMEAIPGVITPSRAMLVRSPRLMSPAKEAAFKVLTDRFVASAKALGKNPQLLNRRVTEQKSFKTGRQMPRISPDTQIEGFRPTWR